MKAKRTCRNFLLLLLLIYMEATSGEPNGTQRSDGKEDGIRSSTMEQHVIRLPENYDNETSPNSPAVDVGCAAYISSLGPFSEGAMKFKIAFYFYCHWVDPRLNTSVIAIVDERERKIWRPQIMPDPYYDSIRVDFVDKVFVTPGGRVLEGRRFTIESTCLMTFYNYPHDKQVCNVPIYFRGGVIARWQVPPVWMKTTSAVSMSLQRVRSMFHINHVEYLGYIGSNAFPEEACIYQKALCDYAGSERCYLTDLRCSEAENQNNSLCIKCNTFGGKCTEKSRNCSSVIEKVSPVNLYFSMLEIRFKLTRRVGYHFLQTYIPSVSVVGMSWVSFWIDPSSAPARTGLGVTTVLTMVTLSGKVKPAPELNYIRAIDVWMLGCKLFVIMALLEYACVNFAVSRKKEEMLAGVPNQPNTSEKKPEVTQTPQEEHGNETSWNEKVTQLEKKKTGPYNMDHVSRVLFPVAYIVFVCSYFVVYIY